LVQTLTAGSVTCKRIYKRTAWKMFILSYYN
jgi:hypothetical protein